MKGEMVLTKGVITLRKIEEGVVQERIIEVKERIPLDEQGVQDVYRYIDGTKGFRLFDSNGNLISVMYDLEPGFEALFTGEIR